MTSLNTAKKTTAIIYEFIISLISASVPTCITLFAGVGGSSLGAQMAGFKELLAIDHDPVAQRNFGLNFKGEHHVPYWCYDIWEISPIDVLRKALIAAGELCVLIITAPCQGFSLATGKFNPLDSRNALFLRGIEFVAGIKPMVAIFENVPGMFHKYHTLIMNEIKSRLREDLGQDYYVFCFQLNALFFLVPSDRDRLFFICIRKDIFMKRPIITPAIDDPTPMTIGNIAPSIQQIQFGQSKKIDRFPNEFMPTITATEGIKYLEGGKWYKLAENEEYLRKFQSFPDSFVLEGTNAQKCKLIGNAVPPNLMAHVLKYIKHDILCFPAEVCTMQEQVVTEA